ncbi:MAG: lysophospholipid acyltransferase family protein [Alkalispirochaeta sp.]
MYIFSVLPEDTGDIPDKIRYIPYTREVAFYLSRKFSHVVLGPVRGTFRLVYFALVFLSAAVVTLALEAVLPSRLFRRMRPRLSRRLARMVLLASNFRLRYEGTPPPSGSMIVANHLSWADTFTFLSQLGCRFVATHVYGSIMGFSSVLRSVGVEFINRMSLRGLGPARQIITRILQRHESLMVFPEGRTSRGEAVRPFRAAFFQVAIDLGIPVAPASIRYVTPPGWPPASVVVGWEEWPPLLVHIWRAFHVPRITCEIRYGDVVVSAESRRVLSEELHARVVDLYRPMPQLAAEALRRIDVISQVTRDIVWGDTRGTEIQARLADGQSPLENRGVTGDR